MPRKNILFCPRSMRKIAPCARNSYGASRHRRTKMFLFGLLLCFFVPDYAEAAFTPPDRCSSTPWIYNGNKMQNISCAGTNLPTVPTDDKEGSDVFRFDLSDNQITSLGNDDFQYFTNLVDLDLSYNQIPSITVDTFSNLTNLRFLDLAANDLSYLPSGTFTAISVEYFNVSRNTNLVFGRRHSDTLRVLDLSYLNLHSVEQAHFVNLVNLREVYLSHNNLTSLERHLFKDLTSLEIINLSWNGITLLDNNQVYKGCSGLKTLDLSNNRIDDVDKDFLKKVVALTNLDLSHNLIASLDQTTFDEVPDLEILYLNDNLLTSLDKDTFKELGHLTSLYLNGNLLSSLDKDTFKEATSLTTLYLNGNTLTTLPDDLFRYNTGLQILYLNENALTTLREDLFEYNSNLQFITLSHNQLSTVPTNILRYQTADLTFDVSSNPYICDCSVRDFFFSIKSSITRTLDNEDDTYCFDASVTRHVYLDYDDDSCSGNLGFNCSDTNECMVWNSQCINRECICSDNYYDSNGITTNGGRCNDKISLDYRCPMMDAACAGSNVECAAKSSSSSDTYCLCKPLYYDDNPQYLDGTCRLKVELGESCVSINDMCRPDDSQCGTSGTCECLPDYYDNDGPSNIGGECLPKLVLYASCNESYQCGPDNSECSGHICSCSDGYYDFTLAGECKDPSGFFSCFPDNTSSVEVVFAKVKDVSTEEECKEYCFEENVRYYHIEGGDKCVCGNTTSSKICCPPAADVCQGRTYLGPATLLAEAGFRFSYVPRLTVGSHQQLTITTNLMVIVELHIGFGDSEITDTVNAPNASVSHTYTYPGLFWITASACTSAKGVCEDASIPVQVHVPPENLATYMRGVNCFDVSADLSNSFSANFMTGYNIDYILTKTCNGDVTKRKGCKPGWIEHRYSCIKLETTPDTFSSARTACAAEGSLLMIDFMEELAEVVTALGASSETFLIGAEEVGGIWQNIDGSKVPFTNSEVQDTSGGACLSVVGSSAELTSISCSTPAKYVCMSSPVDCPKGGDLLSNGYCYVLASTQSVSYKNWTAANDYCSSEFGGWLTTVADATVQAKVTSLLSNANASEGWIGLTDSFVEESYIWGDFSSHRLSSYSPTITSNDGDCFVATSANSWYSQHCSNPRDFVCQYSENIQRLTVPSNVVGWIDVDADQDLNLIVASGSFPSTAASSIDSLLFPGYTFSRQGTIRWISFCSSNDTTGSNDISFQVYRPSCSSGSLFQAGCIPTMFASCSTGSYTCTPSTGCSDTEYFCYLSSSCKPMHEACTCNSVSSASSGCGIYGERPSYSLHSQTSVTFTATGRKCFKVSSDISVHEGDVIGFQSPTGKNVLSCEDNPTNIYQETAYRGTSSNYFAKTDTFPNYTAVNLTCDFQVVYTEDLEQTFPNNLGYSSSYGNCQLEVSGSEIETKHVNVSLEEEIDNVELVYPELCVPSASSASLGTVCTEFNKIYDFTIAARWGTNLISTWSFDTGQTVLFTDSCVPAISSTVGDDCNSTLYRSDKPFATFSYNTSAVGSMNMQVEIENCLGTQSYTLIIETEEKISGVTLSLVTPSLITNNVVKNSSVQIDLVVTEGTGLGFSFEVDGAPANSTNASLFYTFSTIGSYLVSGTVTNILGTHTQSITVYAKQAANLSNCTLSDTSYIAAVGISLSLKMQCNADLGAEVTLFWMFSDGTPNITSAVSFVSVSPTSWTQGVTLTSVSNVTVTASASDPFDTVSVVGTVFVYNAVPSVSLTSNSSDVFRNETVKLTASVPARPGDYGNVTYNFDYDDGEQEFSSSGEVTHAFSTGGNYTVSVRAGNGASSETTTIQVVVYEPVTGLTLIYDGPSQKNDAVTFQAPTSKGNFLLYNFFTSVFNETVSSDTFSYVFPVADDYNVTVTVFNSLSEQTESITAYIMNAGDLTITGFEMDGRPVSSCAETVTGIMFELIFRHYSPTGVYCDWSFGEKRSVSVQASTTCLKTYAFATAGNFTINVTAKYAPHNAEQSFSQEVCLQEKITLPNISVASTVVLPPSGTVIEIVNVTVPSGDPITYAWSTNATGSLTSSADVFSVEFTSEGTFYITVTLFNEVSSETATKIVNVIIEISGLEIACSFCIVQFGEFYVQNDTLYNFTVSSMTGSGISYSWVFGDTGSATGITSSHAYTSIGSYNLTVTGSNVVTTLTHYITVHVETPITSVTVSIRSSNWLTNIRNTSMKDSNIIYPAEFSVTVSPSGMNFIYFWKYDTGVAEVALQTNEGEYNYSTTGLKNCTVTAQNSLGNYTSDAYSFFVIKSIDESTLQVTYNSNSLSGTDETNTYKVAWNQVITFVLSSVDIVPNTVEYFLRLRVQNPSTKVYALQNSTIDKSDPRLSSNLTEAWIYKIEATVTNSIGPASTTVYVEAIRPVSGSSISAPAGQDGNITLGSSLTLIGDATDGDYKAYFWFFAEAPSGQTLTSTNTTSLTVTPGVVGQYIVTLQVYNAVSGPVSVNYTINVMDEVSEVGINDTIANGNAVKVGTSVTFTGTVRSGTNPSYSWDVLVDGSSNGTGSDQSFSFVFSTQAPYNITLVVKNYASSGTAFREIYSLYEVPRVIVLVNGSSYVSSIGKYVAITNSIVIFSSNISNDAFVQHEWRIDGKSEAVTKYFLKNFTNAAEYSVDLNASNHISSENSSIAIVIEDPITDLIIQNCFGIYNISDIITLRALYNGTGVSFEWSNGTGTPATGEATNVRYSAIGVYSVNVTARNHISEETKYCLITIQGVISNLNLTASLLKFVGYPVTIYVTGVNLRPATIEWVFSDGVTNTTTDDATITRMFATEGNYSVVVTATNNVSSSKEDLTFEVVDLACQAPVVTLEGSTERVVRRLQPVELDVYVETGGCSEYDSLMSWTFYDADSCADPLTVEVILPNTIQTNTPSVSLPSNTLNYGRFCVEQRHEYNLTPEVTITYINLTVVESPIIAVLNGGHGRGSSEGDTLTVNASQSIDPDEVPGTVLVYTWSCTQTMGTSAAAYVSSQISALKTSSATFTNLTLKAGDVYNVTVTVSAPNRTSGSTYQIITIQTSTTPEVSVTCVSGQAAGHFFLTSSASVAFEGTCTGCTSSAVYEWIVTDSATGTQVSVDSSQTTTGTNQANFVLLHSVLTANKVYAFMLKVTEGSETGIAEMVLQPSPELLSAGTCTITPSTGIIPLTTVVKCSCTGITDSDEVSSLQYIVTVESTTQYEKPYYVHYGAKSSMEFYPVPYAGTNHGNVNVKITARNFYRAEISGYQRTVSFQRPPSLNSTYNAVDYICDMMVDYFPTLVRQNNPRKLLQYCMAVLSYLNDQSENNVGTTAQRMAIRDVISSALSGLPLTSVHNIQQMATAIENLVKYPEEISLETLSKALTEIESMSDQLNSTAIKGKDQRDYDSETLISANAFLQQALKSVSSVSSDSDTLAKLGSPSDYVLSVSSPVQTVTYTSTEVQTQALIIKSMEFNLQLMMIQLQTMLANENAVEKSGSGYQYFARHVTTDNIEEDHSGSNGMKISVDSDILSLANYHPSSAFQLVYLSDINQYNFAFSDVVPLNTGTATAAFFDPDGNPITVSNLPNGKEVILYMFADGVASYLINDTALRYSPNFDPTLKMNYTNKTMGPDDDTEIPVHVPLESGIAIYVQVRVNSTNSATLTATLRKNGKDFDPLYDDQSKTITADMMEGTDPRNYTFYFLSNEIEEDDTVNVKLQVSRTAEVQVGIFTSICEFFHNGLGRWDNEGCIPQDQSIASVIMCKCNHLTSFGGGLFVSPDQIVFTDLTDIDVVSNPVAVITCSVILGLYIVLVIAFRKLDLLDLKRISLIPLCGKDGSFKYEVTIVTGRLPGAGTTAHVGIRLIGEYGKSARQHVSKAGAFKRNCSDTFIIAYDVNLGELKKFQVWHDNRGTSPSWNLSHVIVNDLQTDQKFYFFGNTWLSLEEENGTIQKELKVAGSSEMSRFSYRMKTAMFNSLADKHLWLSLFNRPAQSRFTRVQRVTCCVTVLFTFVVVNAMWYGLLKKSNTELGFEGFGWEEVVLALVSNLMVLPVNIALVFLFKKSRSKANFFDHVHKPQTAQTLEIENLCENSQGGSFESTNTGAIPYDLERESTIDSVPHTALGLHRSRHVAKTHRENTDDSITQKHPSVAVTKASSKSPLWNEDNIMKWPDSVTFDDNTDSRPSTGSTMAAGPSVRQPPVKAGGSTPGANKKSKTVQKGDAGQLLEELDKLEHELKESESRSVKSNGSKKSSTNLRRPTMHKSQWGSLEDILQSDDESVAESSGKMKKRGSTTSQSTSGKFNPRSDPRINGNSGAWPKSRESVASGGTVERPGRGITSGLRPGYYSEMTMESRDIRIPVHREKCTLPPWCIYIAYILCFLLVAFSTIIVILYCFKFGTQESLKWVLALILSLILSFLVIEPLKALLIAVYVVATFKSVEQDEDDDFIDIEPTFDNSNEKIKEVKFKPISGFALLQAKEEGRKIHRMNVMIRQFLAYVFYLWLIMVIVYVNFHYDTYLMTKHVENDFIAPTTNDHRNFTNITTIDEFWDWTETVFVDSLYKANNTQDEEHGLLLGEARMRLIRGVTSKCLAANAASGLGASSLTDRTCYGQGKYDEDTEDYAEGWNHSNSNYSWRHYSAGELGSTHKIGHVATYGGGGYPQGLGTSSAETDSIIAHLRDKGWIDLQTRAIIFEFALYCAGSDMTAMVALLAEFPLTGGVITSYEIQSQKLLWFQENTVEPLMVLECILFLVIVYSVIHLALQVREGGKAFFKDMWNWYEMLTTLMALVGIGMYIGCVVEATNTFNRFLDNPTGFTNYERAMYVHVGMRYLHAWLLFLLMFKVVKQLRFIKFIYVYERTLSKAVGHLLGTGLIYIILLLVYAQVGYLMYGRIISGFESVGHSITTLIVMIRGSFDFWPMLDHQPIFSHFYVYSYYAFAYGIMIGLVISILTSTYKVIRSQMYYKATLEMQDYEMIDFMLKRFKLLTGIQKPKPAFRRVRFPGLPSVSSRSSSSYSNRSSASLHSAESITGPQFSDVQLRSMMARMAPTWQAVLRRMDKIVALDAEEESLVKKAEDEMKNLNWKCRINELEREHKELLSWQTQPSTSDKPPARDTNQRQSILKRPGASKGNQDRKAPATVSGAPSRTAASTPDESQGAQGRRPLSDQGVRVEQASTSKRRASSNEKSKIQTFFKSIKPSKSAWNK